MKRTDTYSQFYLWKRSSINEQQIPKSSIFHLHSIFSRTEDLYQSGKKSLLCKKPSRGGDSIPVLCIMPKMWRKATAGCQNQQFFYLPIYIRKIIYLAMPGLCGGTQDLHCSAWDLQLQHVGSGSLTRDQTWAPYIGREPSQSLEHQGSPRKLFQPGLVALMVKSWIARVVRDTGVVSDLGRCPGEGSSNPLQYSPLENSTERGAWWATVQGVTKSQTD